MIHTAICPTYSNAVIITYNLIGEICLRKDQSSRGWSRKETFIDDSRSKVSRYLRPGDESLNCLWEKRKRHSIWRRNRYHFSNVESSRQALPGSTKVDVVILCVVTINDCEILLRVKIVGTMSLFYFKL